MKRDENTSKQFNLTLEPEQQDRLKRTLNIGEGMHREQRAGFFRSIARSAEGSDPSILGLRAALFVLADLTEQGWESRIVDSSVVLTRSDRPVTGPTTPQDLRSELRSSLHVGRDRQLREPSVRNFLRSMESQRHFAGQLVSVLSLVDDGADLANHLSEADRLGSAHLVSVALQSILDPQIEVCESGKTCRYTGLLLTDVWRYFRHTWSLEYRSLPGRTLPVLIRNGARPLAPVMGIAMLSSPPSGLKDRDEWLGWTVDSLQKRLEPQGGDFDDAVVREIAVALQSSLRAAITTIRSDDLVSHTDLTTPTDATINELNSRARQASSDRLESLMSGESQRSLSILSDGRTDWHVASERPLFVRKRAATLAQLLEAERVFLEHRIGLDHKLLPTLFQTDRGRAAVATALSEIRKRGLSCQLVDISVCGAVAPYNALLGGKLVALLMASNQVITAFQQRYQGQESLIASQMAGRPVVRAVTPLVLTTTSLYGIRPNQYHRLHLRQDEHPELPWDLSWHEVGQTSGYGTFQFSRETLEALRTFVEIVRGARNVNNVFGEGTNPRMRQIREGLEALGLKSSELLQHGNRRLIYACEIVPNGRSKILEPTENYDSGELPHASAIAEAWRRRWIIKRIRRPDVLAAIASLGPGSVHGQFGHARARQLPLEVSVREDHRQAI